MPQLLGLRELPVLTELRWEQRPTDAGGREQASAALRAALRCKELRAVSVMCYSGMDIPVQWFTHQLHSGRCSSLSSMTFGYGPCSIALVSSSFIEQDDLQGGGGSFDRERLEDAVQQVEDVLLLQQLISWYVRSGELAWALLQQVLPGSADSAAHMQRSAGAAADAAAAQVQAQAVAGAPAGPEEAPPAFELSQRSTLVLQQLAARLISPDWSMPGQSNSLLMSVALALLRRERLAAQQLAGASVVWEGCEVVLQAPFTTWNDVAFGTAGEHVFTPADDI